MFFEDLETLLFQEHISLVHDWMIGKYTSEDINAFVAEQLDIDYKTLLQTFKKDCKEIRVSQTIIEILRTIKDRYYLILATGNMDSFDRFTLPAHDYLYELFDEIHNSYNIGLLKSDNNGAYFKQVLRCYNIVPSESVLLEDSGSTCRIFEELGGTAMKVKAEQEVIDSINRCLRSS